MNAASSAGSEQGELLGRLGGALAGCGELGRLPWLPRLRRAWFLRRCERLWRGWFLCRRERLRGPLGSARLWGAGGAVNLATRRGRGARPADAVLVGELADLAGDPVLVGLRGVGAAAVQVKVPVDKLRMLRPQPGEEPLARARSQVQHDGRDVRGAGRRDLLDRLVQLGGGVGQARHYR